MTTPAELLRRLLEEDGYQGVGVYWDEIREVLAHEPAPDPLTPADLSKLLWDAREIVDTYCDVIARIRGANWHEARSVRERLDIYRAARGWNPDGFGGET